MRGIILVALICAACNILAYIIYYLLDDKEYGITLGFIAGMFYMASTKNIKFDK